MSESVTSSSSLDANNLSAAFNAMHDEPNPPMKILTPADFRRKSVGTYMGVPIVADPLLGKDDVLIEYRDGTRERLNHVAVIDLELKGSRSHPGRE